VRPSGTVAPIGSNLFLAGTSGRIIGNVIRDSRSGQNLRSHLTYVEILYNQILRASEYDLDFTHNYKNESSTSRIVFIGNTLVRSTTATNFEQCFLFGTEVSATGRPAQTLYVYNNTFILVSVRNRLLRGINERMGTVQMTFVNNVIHTTSAATAAGPGVVVDNATGALMTGTNNWATLGMILIPTRPCSAGTRAPTPSSRRPPTGPRARDRPCSTSPRRRPRTSTRWG
jgi:hypothetical protein